MPQVRLCPTGFRPRHGVGHQPGRLVEIPVACRGPDGFELVPVRPRVRQQTEDRWLVHDSEANVLRVAGQQCEGGDGPGAEAEHDRRLVEERLDCPERVPREGLRPLVGAHGSRSGRGHAAGEGHDAVVLGQVRGEPVEHCRLPGTTGQQQ
ncbi:hypothetical protein FHU35_12942 [Saccharopolyspora dendranthemae]|uniref:Uncharacterized protein n=1 Tax=Saccharopolyspora dendranthemae TaxID=1181886 RepID=A0A561U9A5_9PSEU|nr:hypothetical protein [Saccharopolyspora dendranthemae]TWF95942.1 hypothetical protein FHU35_12942 [Saccharopolyspora dendranthemae]